MTIADKISDRFNNDGSVFVDDSGHALWVVASELAVSQDQNWERGSTRYDFNDGSSIVVCGPAWDLGLAGGCHCWSGVGHSENCTAEPSTRTFLVKVRRVVVMTAEIEVEADDEEDAAELAVEAAHGNVDWIADDNDDSDYEVTDID